MKKTILAGITIFFILGAIILVRQKNEQKENTVKNDTLPIPVKIQTVEKSQTISETIEFPAVISEDSSAIINAKSSGTIISLPINLGSFVSTGQFIAKIDNLGTNSILGKNDFESIDIQQLEIALKQAKESEFLAQKNYKADKSNATKTAWDIARLQVESAKKNLSSALDSRNITASISGQIVEKFASVGDSINVGEPLVKIVNTNSIKFQFYIDPEKIAGLKISFPVEIINNNEDSISAKITGISPIADSITRRFLVEAKPTEKVDASIGTITTAKITFERKPQKENSIILPISAITVGQNENYVFIAENNLAKKIIVTISKISGETVEIETDLPEETKIIIGENKLLSDGSPIEIR